MSEKKPEVWRVPSRAQLTIRAGGCVTGPASMWSYPETDPKDPEAVALYAHPPETEALVEALREIAGEWERASPDDHAEDVAESMADRARRALGSLRGRAER